MQLTHIVVCYILQVPKLFWTQNVHDQIIIFDDTPFMLIEKYCQYGQHHKDTLTILVTTVLINQKIAYIQVHEVMYVFSVVTVQCKAKLKSGCFSKYVGFRGQLVQCTLATGPLMCTATNGVSKLHETWGIVILISYWK